MQKATPFGIMNLKYSERGWLDPSYPAEA